MIKLKCVSGDDRLFIIDSLGLKIKDGVKFEIEDSDIHNPDIKMLLKMSIIESEGEIKTQDLKDQLQEDMITFKCTLPLGKRMTLDSIKGTVSGQCAITIPSKSVGNNDIKIALNTGYLVAIDTKELEKSKENAKKVSQPEEIKEIIRDMYADEKGEDKSNITLETDVETKKDNNRILDLEEVSMEEVKIAEKKSEHPKFITNDESKESMQSIGLEMYNNEEPVVEKKKRGRGRPKKSESEEASAGNNPGKKRGRPRKTEATKTEEKSAPKRGRGRPKKTEATKTEEKSAPKRGRGRPKKSETIAKETIPTVPKRGRGRPKKITK
jgi:hypothetical protein